MLPPLGSEPRHWLSFDFQVLHPTTELIPLSAGSLNPLDAYVAMPYWFLDLAFFWNLKPITEKLECLGYTPQHGEEIEMTKLK